MTDKVTLGDHEIEVYPQRHAYITNKVTKVLTKVMEQGGDIAEAGDLAAFLGDSAYAMLTAMLPAYGKRCPEYEFKGFVSKEAMDAGDYDEDNDKSPTFPEQIAAFEVIARVNRFDILKVVKNVIDPKAVKAVISLKVAQWMESGGSLTELSPMGGSAASTSSSTTDPTSTESTGSPGNESTSSHEPELSAD